MCNTSSQELPLIFKMVPSEDYDLLSSFFPHSVEPYGWRTQNLCAKLQEVLVFCLDVYWIGVCAREKKCVVSMI
mgnify:CR=1 FL=1